MGNKYDGTRTLENLKYAFSVESEARNKYTFFAAKAKEYGYEQLAEIYLKTADNEKEHAELWYKELNDLNNTLENLILSANEESYEATEMYQKFAEIAEEEGFRDLAKTFRLVAQCESNHFHIYKKFIERFEDDTVFKDDDIILWRCRECGYIYQGKEAPEECPCCKHKKGYFERFYEYN